jgi:putative endonuclease
MPSYMYILECADGTYYTGSTIDLERRLWQHHNGEGANFTKKRLPVKLVYAEPFDRVEDAFRREKQIQGWSRRKKKALIDGNYDKLIEFSKNYTQYGSPASVDPASTGSASVATNKPTPELVEGKGGEQLAEESRLNALIQENLAKVVVDDE